MQETEENLQNNPLIGLRIKYCIPERRIECYEKEQAKNKEQLLTIDHMIKENLKFTGEFEEEVDKAEQNIQLVRYRRRKMWINQESSSFN